jgi:hypothetical protein
MAEISIRRKINTCFLFRHFYICVLIVLGLPAIVHSQTSDKSGNKKRKVEILHADILVNDEKQGSDL